MSEKCCEHDRCPGGSLCCCPPKPFREIARAEAERRWPNTGSPPTTAPLALAWHDTGMASGFVLGALWATEVTDEMVERGLKVSREFPMRRGLDNARNVMRAVLEAALRGL